MKKFPCDRKRTIQGNFAYKTTYFFHHLPYILKNQCRQKWINVLGTVDTAIKEVITYINSTYITAETIIEFLQQLRRHYLKKPIVVVIEHTQYRHCQTVIKK